MQILVPFVLHQITQPAEGPLLGLTVFIMTNKDAFLALRLPKEITEIYARTAYPELKEKKSTYGYGLIMGYTRAEYSERTFNSRAFFQAVIQYCLKKEIEAKDELLSQAFTAACEELEAAGRKNPQKA